MSNQNLTLPNYSIGKNVYDQIEQICLQYGKSAVIIGGRKAIQTAERRIFDAVNTIKIIDTLWYGGEACVENIKVLKNHKSVKECDMIFALGGGKALDTAKCVAEIAEKPVFTFPTLASNASCCSRISILYHPDGTYTETFMSAKPPVHAFIDTSILISAPAKYFKSGIINTLSSCYSVSSDTRNTIEEALHDAYDEENRTPVDTVMNLGLSAVEDNKNNFITTGYEKVLFSIMIASALFTEAESDDVHQLAAFIMNTLLTVENIQKQHYYSDIAGLATLVLLLYRGKNNEFEVVYEFLKALGYSTSFDDIEITRYQLDIIFESDEYDFSAALDELESRNQFA